MEAINEILKVTNDWKLAAPQEDVYCNELIRVYLKGKSDGMEQAQKLVLDKLQHNIEKSGKVASGIIRLLKDNGFYPISSYLKVENWNDFSIMILIPDKEWGQEQFLEMIDKASDIETSARDEYFNVMAVFCPVEDNFDEKCAISDGYLFKYAV
ncbi:MAG: hypothetical protein LBR08_09865 [Bacteroidales bacterium]|jgi:hypothetical protein|nr:hypothetical protein [Bacteroidales bacterium]